MQAFLGERVFHPWMKNELPEKRLRGRLGYLRMLILLLSSHQIVSFSAKIVAYQELPCKVMLLTSLVPPQEQWK